MKNEIKLEKEKSLIGHKEYIEKYELLDKLTKEELIERYLYRIERAKYIILVLFIIIGLLSFTVFSFMLQNMWGLQ